MRLVATYVHQAGIVVGQRAAGAKKNVLDAVAGLLGQLDVKGRLVTGDALFTQQRVCRRLWSKGALPLHGKGNRPTLQQEVCAIWETAPVGKSQAAGREAFSIALVPMLHFRCSLHDSFTKSSLFSARLSLHFHQSPLVCCGAHARQVSATLLAKTLLPTANPRERLPRPPSAPRDDWERAPPAFP